MKVDYNSLKLILGQDVTKSELSSSDILNHASVCCQRLLEWLFFNKYGLEICSFNRKTTKRSQSKGMLFN